MNLKSYIGGLKFAYIMTYSGLRGVEYDELMSRVNELQRLKNHGNIFERSDAGKELEKLSADLNTHNIRIVDTQGHIYKYASIVCKLDGNESANLLADLMYDGDEIVHLRCGHIFRDAIAFFSDKGEIIAIIHICFSCYRVVDHNNQIYPFDLVSFDRLKRHLRNIGHPISDGESS